MLSKLLKHEYRATARVMLPVYILVAGAALLFNLFMHLADRYNNAALEVFRVTSTVIFIVTLLGAGVVTVGLMVFRFYRNYMSDEGYLMFTLPVTTDQLILSKLIAAMSWTVLTMLAVGVAVFLGTVGLVEWNTVLPQLSSLFSTLVGSLPKGFLPLVAISLLVSSVVNYLLFYAAIALGHSFANHKILLSVVFYFAFSAGMRTISSFFSIFTAAYSDRLFSGQTPDDWISSYATASALIGVFLNLAFAAVFYIVTRLLLKKRLNLQ